MKLLGLLSLLAISTQALAAMPVIGQWYSPYVDHGDGSFAPESLTHINEDGTLKWEVLFQGSAQKQIVVFKTVITENSLQTVSIINQTKCSDTQMGVNPEQASYAINGDTLKVENLPEMKRATIEQIQKFASLKEGCD